MNADGWLDRTFVRLFDPEGVMRPQDRRRWLNFVLATSLFALSWLGAAFAIRTGRVPTGLPAAAAVCVPALLLLVAVGLYVRSLRSADEFHRLMQLEGLAAGFGVGLIWLVLAELIRLARHAGDPGPMVEIAPFLMISGYSIGVFLSRTRRGLP